MRTANYECDILNRALADSSRRIPQHLVTLLHKITEQNPGQSAVDLLQWHIQRNVPADRHRAGENWQSLVRAEWGRASLNVKRDVF
jgi:hypothetical protein